MPVRRGAPLTNMPACKQDLAQSRCRETEGENAMTEADIAVDLSEQTMLAIEVSDEAIEAAACAGPHCAKAFSISFCTGSEVCPY
jgi:hypothetical protein